MTQNKKEKFGFWAILIKNKWIHVCNSFWCVLSKEIEPIDTNKTIFFFFMYISFVRYTFLFMSNPERNTFPHQYTFYKEGEHEIRIWFDIRTRNLTLFISPSKFYFFYSYCTNIYKPDKFHLLRCFIIHSHHLYLDPIYLGNY